jgi:FkbM family methyltransferase
LYLNPEAQAYQAAMLNGTFDDFLFSYVDRSNWTGKTIYDLGAHVGFHTLNFAERVGTNGHVYSFEPHPLHLERVRLHLDRSPDLAARTTVFPIAASDRAGTTQFRFADTIERGGSSASFIEGASTAFPRSHYQSFQTMDVETARLDDLVAQARCAPPDLMKIDVEGAEGLLLTGAVDTLKKFRPRIVIEVHSIPNMLRVGELLVPLGYAFSILQDEDRRCFIAAEPANGPVRPSSG